MRVKTAGYPLVQPDDLPKEETPISVRLSTLLCTANGPPESPVQVDLPPVVSMQMFVDLIDEP